MGPIYNSLLILTAGGEILIRGSVGTDCQHRLSGNGRIFLDSILTTPIDLQADMSHPDNITCLIYRMTSALVLYDVMIYQQQDRPKLNAMFAQQRWRNCQWSICGVTLTRLCFFEIHSRHHWCFRGQELTTVTLCALFSFQRVVIAETQIWVTSFVTMDWKSSTLSPRLHLCLLGLSVSEKVQML